MRGLWYAEAEARTMLRSLHMKDVGPAARFDLELGSRLNVLTGDNGLGKSFVLDVAWWVLTGTWVGRPVLPHGGSEDAAAIAFQIDLPRLRGQTFECQFQRPRQDWSHGVIHLDGIRTGFPDGTPVPTWLGDHPWAPVVHARADGGFSIWDPARNYSGQPAAPSPYHFSVEELWYGLTRDEKTLSNGLIRDWTTWQLEATGDEVHPFHLMTRILRALSHPDEPMVPGKSVRLYHDDARRYPTIDLPYGNVPIVHASAGMRRIIGLAYLLTWTWTEHVIEAKRIGRVPADRLVFLIDEVESHLHPQWQRHILPRLLEVLAGLGAGIEPQVLATTHSPMVLASLEPHFDTSKDKLFSFDLEAGEVSLREVPWASWGDAGAWLTSPIFGLRQPTSPEAETAIEAAHSLIEGDMGALPPGLRTEDEIDRALKAALGEQDPFWVDWLAWRKHKVA